MGAELSGLQVRTEDRQVLNVGWHLWFLHPSPSRAAGLLHCASCGQEWTERREQGPEHPEEAQDRGAGGHWDPSEEGPFPATHSEDTVVPPASLWEPPPPLGPWQPESPDPGCLSKDTTRHEARITQPSSTHISGRSEDWDGGGRAPWKGELMAGCPWLPLIMGI